MYENTEWQDRGAVYKLASIEGEYSIKPGPANDLLHEINLALEETGARFVQLFIIFVRQKNTRIVIHHRNETTDQGRPDLCMGIYEQPP